MFETQFPNRPMFCLHSTTHLSEILSLVGQSCTKVNSHENSHAYCMHTRICVWHRSKDTFVFLFVSVADSAVSVICRGRECVCVCVVIVLAWPPVCMGSVMSIDSKRLDSIELDWRAVKPDLGLLSVGLSLTSDIVDIVW